MIKIIKKYKIINKQEKIIIKRAENGGKNQFLRM